MIRFTDHTSITEVDEVDHPIQPEKFRFRNYNSLMELADKNEELPG